MRIKSTFIRTALWLLIAAGCFSAAAQGNVPVTYQGQLLNNGSPANGLYSLTFTLYTNSSGGGAVAVTETNNNVSVNNGLFATVFLVNTNVYGDKDYTNWLELGVATNGTSVFTTLAERQQLTFVPFAINALNAGTAAIATSATNFSGFVSGDVSGTQSATVVISVGGQPATNIASGVIAANSATSSNSPNTIVKRDGSGNFSAGSVTLNGSLHLSFPTVIYSGTNTLLIEEGDLFLGANAGNNVNSGGQNVGLGDDVLSSGSTGIFNVGVGEDSLAYDTSGSENTAVGFFSLGDNTIGNFNTATGSEALSDNTSGFLNTANGAHALWNNVNGSYNTANGANALSNNVSGFSNTADGANALANNTTGDGNTANGFEALFQNTSGLDNTANGDQALYRNTIGTNNTANGYEALGFNTSGFDNTANGSRALFNNTSGSDNTADGVTALQANTIGIGNTADGYGSLFENSNGSLNTAVGEGALNSNMSGSGNTALGFLALYNCNYSSNNIALGYLAGYNIPNFGIYNIDIGNEGASDDVNTIRIGTQGIQTSTFIAGIYGTLISGGLPVYVNSSGQLGSSTVVSGFSLQVGVDNHVTNSYSSIAGGTNNTVSADESSILGGYSNAASGAASSVDGGSGNKASGDHANVTGGEGNTASGTHSFVGSGLGNTASSDEDVVVGGISNSVAGDPAFIGAGQYNTVGSFSGTGKSGIAINSFVVAGAWNQVYSDDSGIGGGFTNSIGTNANYSFVGGGSANSIVSGSANATIAGGNLNSITSGSYSTVGGGGFNNINSAYSVVGGGLANNIGVGADSAVLGGGSNNLVTAVQGTVPGGGNNVAGGFASFAAGEGARALNNDTFVWSDGASPSFTSTAKNQFLIQASGYVGINTNNPQAPLHVAGARTGNSSQPIAMIENLDGSPSSSSALRVVAHGGPTQGVLSVSTAWPGGTGPTNVLIAQFGNKSAYVGQLDNNGNLTVSGSVTANGVLLTSDRNAKEDFQPVDSRAVLARVAALPVTEWNYKTDEPGVQHIGPMAQDFQAAFGLDGADDKHISVVDEGGVALAAIQGLNQKLEETQQSVKDKDVEIQNLKQQNNSLAERLNELEAAVKQLATQK
jgi:hypothetical protein